LGKCLSSCLRDFGHEWCLLGLEFLGSEREFCIVCLFGRREKGKRAWSVFNLLCYALSFSARADEEGRS